MDLPNPLTILNASIKRVPAVKWALGIAGIVAVIAIVEVGWKIDPMDAVLGTIVMLVLMVSLVIFARLSTTAAAEFRYAIQVFMWASLCLTILAAVLLFTSVFFQWPITLSNGIPYRSTAGDREVWDLEEQVNLLRGSWESVPEYGEGKRTEVLERATKLAQELSDIEDSKLGPSGHVIKREFSCYAFIMAADTESDVSRKDKFAESAIDQCNSASADLKFIFDNKDRSRNLRYTADWAKRKDQAPFVDYLLAMATCLQATTINDQQKKIDAMTILQDRVPTFYLNRYPPDRDSTLKPCSKIKEAKNGSESSVSSR